MQTHVTSFCKGAGLEWELPLRSWDLNFGQDAQVSKRGGGANRSATGALMQYTGRDLGLDTQPSMRQNPAWYLTIWGHKEKEHCYNSHGQFGDTRRGKCSRIYTKKMGHTEGEVLAVQ